ncbi:MAG: hypothetical protein ACKN9U_00385, partial [Pirellulaceae bacterium]
RVHSENIASDLPFHLSLETSQPKTVSTDDFGRNPDFPSALFLLGDEMENIANRDISFQRHQDFT